MKAFKVIRVLTAAPLLAFATLLHLFILCPEQFGGCVEFSLLVGCLVLLPLLAYPLQAVFPSFRDKGRDGQRSLAILFAFTGYIVTLALAIVMRCNSDVILFILVYLFSGSLIAILNLCFHVHASGHACGAVGPLVILFHYLQRFSVMGAIVLILVWVSSMKMQRHKWYELLIGTIIPVVSILLALWIL